MRWLCVVWMVVVGAVAPAAAAPNLSVTWTGAPTPLDFGTAAVAGGTTTRTITVSNPGGTTDLTFTLVVSTGSSDYSVPATVDVIVAPDASTSVTVTFDPSTSGTRNGSVLVTANDPANPDETVALTGVGNGAVFGASPASIDFGNTTVVGTFTETTLTITNNGNQPGSVTDIQSGNTVFTATVVGDPLPRLLNPTESVQFTIRFTPANGMIVSSSLTVTTDGTPAALQVPVSGDGLYKAVEIVATNEPDLMIDLGPRRVGVLFAQVVTVTNLGEIPQQLELPTSSNTADCTVMPTTPAALPASLDPAEAATFEIRVTPHAVGAGTCTITVTTDIPSTDSVIVDWSGIAPEVEVTTPATPAIDFGVVDVDDSPVIRTVVLHNTGSAPLAIGPCNVAGNSRFVVLTSCTDLTVAPLASATLMIGFDPAVEASESGTLDIGVDALSASNVAIALSGVGADQRLDLSSLALSFPDTSVNTGDAPIEYIDIHNPANPSTGVAETLHIASAQTDNAVFTLANEGPFTVDADTMIRLAVTFTPTAAGVYQGSLVITSDAAGQPMAVIALDGRGIVEAADESGGCCDTGSRGSHAAPLALVVLALLLRRRRTLVSAARGY